MNKENFNLTDFDKVIISGPFDFIISRSDSYSVSLTKSWFQNIVISKDGHDLRVYRHWYDVLSWFTPWSRPSLEVQMPDITGLELSGACEGSITGFKSSNNFKLAVRGASRLTGNIIAGDAVYKIVGASVTELASSVKAFRLTLTGASDFRGTLKADDGNMYIVGASKLSLSGEMRDVVIRAEGASNLDLKDLITRNTEIRLTGASRCSVNTDGKLDADLSGACRLAYSGSPVMGNVRTVGASTITKA